MPSILQRVISGAGALAVLTTGSIVMASPAQADYVNKNTSQQVKDVFDGMNNYRVKNKVPKVKYSIAVSKMSNDWSKTLAQKNLFYHNPNYAKKAPKNWYNAGEIIAANWNANGGKMLVDQWIKSAPHRAIMISPGYNVVGIGIARGNKNSYTLYGTVNWFTYGKTSNLKIVNPYVTSGAIGTKWEKAGAYYSKVGYPTSGINKLKAGSYQKFENGNIYYSAKTGAWIVKTGAIRTAWGKTKYENGKLGYPKGDEYVSKGVTYQKFQGGTISWTSKKGAKVTYNK